MFRGSMRTHVFTLSLSEKPPSLRQKSWYAHQPLSPRTPQRCHRHGQQVASGIAASVFRSLLPVWVYWRWPLRELLMPTSRPTRFSSPPPPPPLLPPFLPPLELSVGIPPLFKCA